jgi:hypothetical protein
MCSCVTHQHATRVHTRSRSHTVHTLTVTDTRAHTARALTHLKRRSAPLLEEGPDGHPVEQRQSCADGEQHGTGAAQLCALSAPDPPPEADTLPPDSVCGAKRSDKVFSVTL